MQQVQNINQIKANIARIIDDCKNYKNQLHPSQGQARQSRFKIVLNQKQQITKSMNLESFIKNMNSRVQSLQSLKSSSSATLRRNQCVGLSRSQLQISQQSQSQSSLQRRNSHNSQNKSKQYFPKLMAKYRRTHHPKNASSSQKYAHLDTTQNLQLINEQEYPTYHYILKQRKKEQQLQRISIVSKLVKQRVFRQNKQLVERKKQRRLQSLNIKQIVLKRSCTGTN